MRTSIIGALGQAPLSDARKKALIDLVTDERFRPLWTANGGRIGDHGYRDGAAAALNAHAGKELISDQEKLALMNPATSEATLATVLEKARSLAGR